MIIKKIKPNIKEAQEESFQEQSSEQKSKLYVLFQKIKNNIVWDKKPSNVFHDIDKENKYIEKYYGRIGNIRDRITHLITVTYTINPYKIFIELSSLNPKRPGVFFIIDASFIDSEKEKFSDFEISAIIGETKRRYGFDLVIPQNIESKFIIEKKERITPIGKINIDKVDRTDAIVGRPQKSQPYFKNIRLTKKRNSKKNEAAVECYVYIISFNNGPFYYKTDLNFKIYTRYVNLEKGDLIDEYLTDTKNLSDAEEKFSFIVKSLIESKGFVDNSSLDYIPEGSNSSNWNFEYNFSKTNIPEKVQDTGKSKFDELMDAEDILLSNKNNWYKTAQTESWYNEETAKTTKDPEILRKILEKWKDNWTKDNWTEDSWISYYAVQNPNCPPEALKIVLERGKNDFVSRGAARNPNCPSEALKMVLERGKNDGVSWNAASNPNCPPEALKMVLERGKKNDYVSNYAAQNPNCPLEAKIKWMEAFGKIEKFDPNNPNHKLPKQKPDKDLEDFRKLVSNSNWYKTAQNNFNQFFQGEVPDYMANLIGTPSVDISRILPFFSGTSKSVDLVNQFDASLLKNVSVIFNSADSGSYGVYVPALDKAIKTKALKKQLEEHGYEIKDEGGVLVAYPKKEEKTNDEIQNDINTLYKNLESKGGTIFGVNMSKDIMAARENAQKLNSPDPNLWQLLAVAEIGATIAHEARHAQGGDESTSQLTEDKFIQWALPKINEEYKRVLEGMGKGEEFAPIILKRSKRETWYKTAKTEFPYDEEIAETTKDPEILRKILVKDRDDWVSRNAAQNLNCPPEALKMVLERGKDNGVSCCAASNPNCPPEVLKMVLERIKDSNVHRNAVLNPNCPQEVLKMILERGEDDWASCFAAKNPNCPPEAKIRWMEAIGKIENFDPNNPNHKLPKQEPDKDLEDFRKLVSNSNWYKTAQTESWYNERIAKTTKDPEILRKILEKGNNDWISSYAASNENCPPETLKMVLERGKDDLVSWKAAQNPKCPPEALKMALERGKDDDVSWSAAINKNCPPEALKMVLERGKDNGISWHAAKNPNCPPEAKIKWMEETGKIENFDPNNPNHKLPKQEPDKDLEDFRKLVSNSNWYKTAQMSGYMPNFFFKNKDNALPSKSSGLPEWSMSNRSPATDPIESKLGRQFMFPLPPDISQENDSIELQLRKLTKDDYKPNPHLIYEELLEDGYGDPTTAYKTTEELMEETRPSPLMIPLKKAANTSLNKIATLFGWMNNLAISDGNTIPGLGDRVMEWDDRDEDFAWSEDEIRKQPRYNPEYYGYGYYYEWVEPRYSPELFDNMIRDYTNTHPAKRFASNDKEENKELVKIIKILNNAKEAILNGEISVTRFVVTVDLCDLINKIMSDNSISIDIFETRAKEDSNGEQPMYSVWVYDSNKFNNEDIEKIDNCFTHKKLHDIKDKLNIFKPKTNYIEKIVNEAESIAKEYGFKNVYIIGSYAREKMFGKDPEVKEINFNCGMALNTIKFGNVLADKLNIKNRYYDKKGIFGFYYKGIKVDFNCGYCPDEISSLMVEKGIPEKNPLIVDICNRDFTINMCAYNIISKKIEFPIKAIESNINKVKTFFNSDSILSMNPLIILNAIKMRLKYGLEIDPELENSMIKYSIKLLKNTDKERLKLLRDQIIEENPEEYCKVFEEYNLKEIKDI